MPKISSSASRIRSSVDVQATMPLLEALRKLGVVSDVRMRETIVDYIFEYTMVVEVGLRES